MFQSLDSALTVRRIVDGASSLPAIFSSLLLLLYAQHSMLSGRLNGPEFLELRGEVISSLKQAVAGPTATRVNTFSSILAFSSPTVFLAAAESSRAEVDKWKTSKSRANTVPTPQSQGTHAGQTPVQGVRAHRQAIIDIVHHRGGKDTMIHSVTGRHVLVLLIL